MYDFLEIFHQRRREQQPEYEIEQKPRDGKYPYVGENFDSLRVVLE
jgi:hypothetical protein